MRFLSCASLTAIALLALGCTPPAAAVGSADVSSAAGPPREVEVTVRMASELEQPEQDLLLEVGKSDDERGEDEAYVAAPLVLDRPSGDASPPPPPPPPPPPHHTGKNSKQKALEGQPSPQAATADSAGAKVDSTTIQQVIAKNVGSFKPCLRSDMALRLEATISPSGDVLEAQSARSFPDDAKARDCVVLAVKRLRFERFEGGVPARVSFELTLKRALDY